MSNLDDFFKKRDKKKKTGQKSKLDIDELSKKLEQTTQIVNQDFNDDLTEPSATATTTTTTTTITTQPSDAIIQDDSSIPLTAQTAAHAQQTATSNSTNGDQMDEDWKPFDSDENKDYTGLRINIQNWKIEDQELENDGLNDENEKKTNCPWAAAAHLKKTLTEAVASKTEENKTQEEAKLEAPPAEVETTTKTVESSQTAPTTTTTASSAEPASSTAGAYVPPALRRQMQQPQPTTDSQTKPSAEASTTAGGRYVPPHLRQKDAGSSATTSAIPPTSVNFRRPNKSQPNINDTLEFPTLDAGESSSSSSTTNATTGDKLANGTERFEMPKKSGSIQQKSAHNMIDLDNKFTALQSSANN